MKYNDDSLMEEAYSQIFEKTKENENTEVLEESVWDRIKGTGSGIVQGAKKGYNSFVDPETKSFSDVGKEISTHRLLILILSLNGVFVFVLSIL